MQMTEQVSNLDQLKPGRHDRSLRGFLAEPLVHFLVLAGLLFVAQAMWSTDTREEIIVDLATQEFLIKQQQDLRLKTLSPAEKRQAIDAHIEDELLVRAARSRGFNNSARIRRLLIQNMRYFIASDPGTPSEEVLRGYFKAHRARFDRPAVVTYDHVFHKGLGSVPSGLLAKLNGGDDHTKLGDFTSSARPSIPRAGQKAIVGWFGAKEAARILNIKDEKWHGPFNSRQGVHYLRVAERFPARPSDFATAKNWVEGEWRLAHQRQAIKTELAKIRKSYRIDIEKPAEDGK